MIQQAKLQVSVKLPEPEVSKEVEAAPAVTHVAASVQVDEPPKVPEPVVVTPPPAAVVSAAVGFDSKFVQNLLEAQVACLLC